MGRPKTPASRASRRRFVYYPAISHIVADACLSTGELLSPRSLCLKPGFVKTMSSNRAC